MLLRAGWQPTALVNRLAGLVPVSATIFVFLEQQLVEMMAIFPPSALPENCADSL
jgi:hypothetical protein